MKKKEIRSRALQLMQEGKSKQEAFDELLSLAQTKPEDLAKMLCNIPSPRARQKYMTLHVLLCIGLGITILLRLLGVSIRFAAGENNPAVLLVMLPILSSIFLFAVLTYKGHIYQLIAGLSVLSFIRIGFTIFVKLEPVLLFDLGLTAAIAGLALLMSKYMTPGFRETRRTERDEQGKARLRRTFYIPD